MGMDGTRRPAAANESPLKPEVCSFDPQKPGVQQAAMETTDVEGRKRKWYSQASVVQSKPKCKINRHKCTARFSKSHLCDFNNQRSVLSANRLEMYLN
jgi:hypothetical protein